MTMRRCLASRILATAGGSRNSVSPRRHPLLRLHFSSPSGGRYAPSAFRSHETYTPTVVAMKWSRRFAVEPKSFASNDPHAPSSSTAEVETEAEVAAVSSAVAHRPPLPVRVVLVSATTALATPSFPALGFLYVVLRFSVKDAFVRSQLLGKYGSILSWTTWTLAPFLYSPAVASLLLPCAVGNAIAAGAAYAVLDVCTGGPDSAVLQKPHVAGAGLGAFVGLVAPLFLYGPCFESLYGLEGMTNTFGRAWDIVPLSTEVSAMTGAVAGMVLHPLVYYPAAGVPGYHWAYLTMPPLVLVLFGLHRVYRADVHEDQRLPVPDGSYVPPSKVDLLESIPRYNRSTDEVETYSLRSGNFIGPPDLHSEGRVLAEACRRYANNQVRWMDSWFDLDNEKVMFDDPILALVYNYTFIDVTTRNADHIIRLSRSTGDIQKVQDSLCSTDAVVAAILHRRRSEEGVDQRLNSERDSIRSTDPTEVGLGGSTEEKLGANVNLEGLQRVLDEINGIRNKNRIDKKNMLSWTSHSKFDRSSMEEVGIATELLMAMRNDNADDADASSGGGGTDDKKCDMLESYVRSRLPDIVLYAADETCCGTSVECQLESVIAWRQKDGGGTSSTAALLERWEALHRDDNRQKWKNRVLLTVAGGILVSIGGLCVSK